MTRLNYSTPGSSWSTSNGLDYEAVLRDFGLPNSFDNLQAVGTGKSLVNRFTLRNDGSFAVARLAGDEFAVEVVTLGHTEHGTPSVYCTCRQWRDHHRHPGMILADPKWLCKHGAAVLLGSGYSPTYIDWAMLPAVAQTAPPLPREETPYYASSQRHAMTMVHAKSSQARWAEAGLDGDMIHEAMRHKFGVTSLSMLSDEMWAKMVAILTAMRESRQLLHDYATEFKQLLAQEAANV